MKVGIRKPSIKKSFKARTTGMVKRKVKSAINPFYGKKGIGFIRNPKRAVKNAVYHRTTIGIRDLISNTPTDFKQAPVTRKATTGDSFAMSLIFFCALMFLLFGFFTLSFSAPAAVFAFICSLSAFFYFVILRKKGY